MSEPGILRAAMKAGAMKTLRNFRFLAGALLFVIALGTAGLSLHRGMAMVRWLLHGHHHADHDRLPGGASAVACWTRFQRVHHSGRSFAAVSGDRVGDQALLEFELQSFFGRRRMERDIGRLRITTSYAVRDEWDGARLANWRAGRRRS